MLGLQMAWDLGFRKIILECDSKALVVALSSGKESLNDLIQVLETLFKLAWEVEVVHV